MADACIRDWINEYKSLDEAEILSFGSTILENNDLIQALFTVLEDKRYHQEFLEAVCQQLFLFYQSKEENFQRFTHHYIPCLIGIYLSHVAKGTRQDVRCIEILLLGIYNLEVVDSAGKPLSISVRIPSIAKPSLYHEPMSLSHSLLTEDALSTLEYQDCRKFTLGPSDEVEKINASNRLLVMTTLMWLYNQHIGFMTSFSHVSLCKMCMKIVKQGFSRSSRSNSSKDTSYGNPHPRPIARIPLSTSFLLEMVHAIYYVMFNGLASVGLQSLEELHNRATHEMVPDVLLVTNAILNSLKVNPSGQPSDAPMGLSVSLSPTTVLTSVSRAITNASFRTKKLPDDIPIQGNGEVNDSHPLSSINEEENSDAANVQSAPPNRNKKQTGNSISSHLSAVTKVGVLQLRKDKNKDKRKESIHSESNGKPLTSSASAHSDMSTSIQNNEEFHHLSNRLSDQTPIRHSYPYKIEQVQKSLVSSSSDYNHTHSFNDDRIYEGKCINNFSNPDLNSVLKSDVKYSGFHKSESANGIQCSSMQTAV